VRLLVVKADSNWFMDSRTLKFMTLIIIAAIAAAWGTVFPGAWAMSSKMNLFGGEFSTWLVMGFLVLLSIFLVLIGLVRYWNIEIGNIAVITSREFFILAAIIMIFAAFTFNGFDILEFFIYYYELVVIVIYYLVGLTLIPSIVTILFGVVVLIIGYLLNRKKEDLAIGRWTIPLKQSSNLLIIGLVSIAVGILLLTIFQPNYIGTFGDPETDGILKTIEGLIFPQHIIDALTDFYLTLPEFYIPNQLVIYSYPMIIFLCGILIFKFAFAEPSHSILKTEFKESLETSFPKISRTVFTISGIIFLIVVGLFALIGIEWYLGFDTSISEIFDLQTWLFKTVLSLFILSIILIIVIYIPKAITPFLDSRILRYTARRLLAMIPMFVGISIISYGLMASTGNPVDLIISRIPAGRNRDVVRNNLMRVYGLNAPIQSQWFNWFFHFIMGDFGNSIQTGVYVADAIALRIGPTLEISIIPLILALVLSIPLGIYAALKQYAWQDNTIAIFVSFGLSIPVFLLIILCIIAFSFYIPILPPSGRNTPSEVAPGIDLEYVHIYFNTFINNLFDWYTWDLAFHMILPIIAITILSLALYVRLIRSGYLEIVNQDYILSAQAYGFRDRTIIFHHALRNVLIPIVTYIGLSIGGLLGGAPLTETTLSWPGLGSYGVLSIYGYDYPVVMGLIMVTAVLILLANLFTDIIYSVIDPRVAL
jgi:peptide/nickel transport system permease protein